MYTIIKPKDNNKYLFIEKDNNILYIQLDYFHGWNISTVHKPNRDIGSSAELIKQETDLEKILMQIDTLLKTDYPLWLKQQYKDKLDLKTLKYKTLDSFLKDRINDISGYDIENTKTLKNHILNLKR